MVVDVLDFGQVISIAKMTLTVNIANQRQHRRVTGAILERQVPYMWKQPGMRDFREVIARDFTEELQIQILGMSRSTFVALWRLLHHTRGSQILLKNTCKSLLCQVTCKCDKECFHCNYAKYAFLF